ncbi:MAG: P-loop NTPase, partial [Armatimonadetes bacterium]|nr:P-loop NTPase [Armatimonadota bacterium]
MELHDYLAVLLRRKWIIAYAFAAVFLTNIALAFLQPQSYQAVSRVMIEQTGLEVMLLSEPAAVPKWVSLETRAAIIRSYPFALRIQKILSEERKIFLTTAEIQASISCRFQQGSEIIEIAAVNQNRDLASALSAGATDAFIQYNKETTSQEAVNARTFIEGRLDLVRKQMAGAQMDLQRFLQKENIRNLDSELDSLHAKMLEYDNERKSLQNKIAANELRIRGLTGGSAGEPLEERRFHDPVLSRLRDKLITLETSLNTLLVKYTPRHPRVLALQSQIQGIRRQMQGHSSEIADFQDPTILAKIQELRSDIAVGKERMAHIPADTLAVKKRIAELASKRQIYGDLQRRLSSADKTYHTLIEKVEDARIRESMTVGDAKVIEKAQSAIPLQKAGRNLLGLSAALGLLLGLGTAVLLEYVDNTIKTSDEVKRYLSLPVLGMIPHLEKESPIVSESALKSSLNEAYQAICFAIEHGTLELGARTLFVTSCKQGEGKTTIVCNMAISMARTGEKVILIDGDLRRPRVHHVFRVENDLGLSNILRGELEAERALSKLTSEGTLPRGLELSEEDVDRALKATQIEGLSVLTSGPVPPNPIELLKSGNLRSLIEILKKKANIILVDTPPAEMVVDAMVMASVLDASVLILESGRITRKEADDLKQMFLTTESSILGVVINSASVER